MSENSPKQGRPLLIVAGAVVVLAALSLVPWSDITNNYIKDFNLFEDILRTKDVIEPQIEYVALEEVEADSVTKARDSVAVAAQPLVGNPDVSPERVDGIMPLEDYSANHSGLSRFKSALHKASSRLVRIAVIGDSYIEGDIFTQNLRSMLQGAYGGEGVGYVPLHTDFPGFRQSVRQSDNGWKSVDSRHIDATSRYHTLSGEYFIGTAGASARYRGTTKLGHANEWSHSSILFVAGASGSISIALNDDEYTDYAVAASDSVQVVDVWGKTSDIKIKNNIEGLKALGVWLDASKGVAVDCMSLRGNNGLNQRNLNNAISREMSRYINYDLIILEYGINAISPEQSDYNGYTASMAKTIRHIKECYPSADILVMGAADRGSKQSGQVHSLPVVQSMVRAQRAMAQSLSVVFWDTRAAMGGQDASVRWHERGLVNADYIHLNHQGGKALADELFNAIQQYVNE
jgi:lysophospholipase L1-like esterase